MSDADETPQLPATSQPDSEANAIIAACAMKAAQKLLPRELARLQRELTKAAATTKVVQQLLAVVAENDAAWRELFYATAGGGHYAALDQLTQWLCAAVTQLKGLAADAMAASGEGTPNGPNGEAVGRLWSRRPGADPQLN